MLSARTQNFDMQKLKFSDQNDAFLRGMVQHKGFI